MTSQAPQSEMEKRTAGLGQRATVVGILLAALYQPIWTSAIDSAKSLALAVILFAGLQIWNIAPWILVVIGAVIGGIFL
jgi:chromate transporter